MRYSLEHYEKNDPHFEKDLKKSEAHVNFLVDLLNDKGYKLKPLKGKLREKIEDMCKYSDEGDAEIEYTDGRIGIIEMKRRFSCDFQPDYFPYKDGNLCIDVQHHYDKMVAKGKEPDGYIITNKDVTYCYFVNCQTTKKHWIKVQRWDRGKKRLRYFYDCNIRHLRFGKIRTVRGEILTF